MSTVLASGWTDASSIGYPVVFGGVLLGSIVPVVPTGAVVGAAAAVATSSGHLDLMAVLVLATLAAWTGDVITFAVCRSGGPSAVRWVARGQHADRIAEVREQFRRHGWQIIVAGRLLPAGRIPVLLAAGALAYPWRRLLPAGLAAAALWASAYALLGVVSGGVFDSPLVATLIATLLVLLVSAVLNLVGARRRAAHREDAAAGVPPAPPARGDRRRRADRPGADALRPRRRPVGAAVTRPAERGRVLQRGRTPARVLLTWVAATVTLVLLDSWLDGFSLGSWWQPPLVALLLGLLTGVVWPLVMRVALPVAFLTLGLGSFLLLGLAVVGGSFLVPGVVVENVRTGVLVVVVLAAVTGLVSSALALDEDELFFRRARRRARRAGDAGEQPPGVLFLQIDALSSETARRAVRDGSMPNVAALLRSGSHAMTSWHTDWSSQTGAEVSGILLGSNHDVFGFRWYEKERDRLVRVSHPEDAAMVESRLSDGRGLLAGGGAGRGQPVHRRRAARQPDDELAGARRPRGQPPSAPAATASAPATTPTSPTR